MKTRMAVVALLAACSLLLPFQPAAQSARPTERALVFISDVHLGVGKDAGGNWMPIEDFRWPNALDGFLAYVERTYEGKADLVILGDFLELWQPFPGMACTDPEAEAGCSVAETAVLAAHVGVDEDPLRGGRREALVLRRDVHAHPGLQSLDEL